MVKPTILTIDDDPVVLRAVQRDLRAHYGKDFRILASDSGAEAIGVLRELRLRNDPVALFVADQRMPQMTGVEFLAEAMEIFPDAKRTLLTAYADTEAAIQAINTVGLDHYIMKPWEPPESNLYPILDDLIDDWLAEFRPRFEGITVIGSKWGRATHEIRVFLSRNQVPFRTLTVGEHPEADSLLRQIDNQGLPVVLTTDGTHLTRPTLAEVANTVGLKTKPSGETYDLVIVGAGPAGLAAAVYGASEGLHTLLIEGDAPGGQAGQSSRIENYLGFPKGISGADLARRASTQAARFGVEILNPAEAVSIVRKDPYRLIRLSDGATVTSKAVLIATGVSYRTLDVPGFSDLTGAGIYYGASRTEATAHEGEEIFVIGGGNSAGQAAMFLSGFASNVTIVIRRQNLATTMSQYLIDALQEEHNITVMPSTAITKAYGDGHLETIDLDTPDGPESRAVGAIFIYVGQKPRTEWLNGLVALDEKGYILSGTDCGPRPANWNLDRSPMPFETSVPGIFVAGDVRFGSIKRVASSTGEGAMSVKFIHEHLAEL